MLPESVELRALRQVSEGALTIHDGGYVLDGHPVIGELAHALVRLRTGGYLAVGPRGPGGHRLVQTTPAGAARLAELQKRHG